jgi:hypothetical protein
MTYASRLRAEQVQQKIGNWPGSKRSMPEWMLDAIAEKKLTGGYQIRPKRNGVVRNPVCPNCNIAKSNSGSCCES